MPYAVADVELTEELPELGPEAGQDGLALLVRRRGRPLAFVLADRPPGVVLPREELGRLLATHAGAAVLREALAEELPPGLAAAPALHAPVLAPVLAPGARLDAGWEAAVAEALAEQPDAAVVTGPAVPFRLIGAEEIAAEWAYPPRFGKLRVAPREAGEPPPLPVLRALAAAGAAVVRPGAGPADRPAAALAAALRAGRPVAYEPGLLARTPGGLDARAAAAAARERGAATVTLLAAFAEGSPALRAATRGRAVRWLVREGRRAVLQAGARRLALAELAGGTAAAPGLR